MHTPVAPASSLRPSTRSTAHDSAPRTFPPDLTLDMPAADGDGTPTARAAGNLAGRPVVVGLAPPDHRLSSRRQLAWATPLGALLGAAGAYAGASHALQADDETRQVYAAHLSNVLAGAGGLLAGALLPPAIAWARYVLGQCREQALLHTAAYREAGAQLHRLVDHALDQAPFTEEGFQVHLRKMQALAQSAPAEISGQDLAMAFAELGRLAPVEGSLLACDTGAYDPLEAVAARIGRLRFQNAIDSPSFSQALLALPTHRAAALDQGYADLRQLATVLLYEFRSAEGAPAFKPGIERDADFLVRLRALPAFAAHRAVVDERARRTLDWNAQTCASLLPPLPVRAAAPRLSDALSPSPSRPTASPISRFLAKHQTPATVDAGALDALVMAWATWPGGALGYKEVVDLNQLLDQVRARDKGTQALVAACQRTHFFLNHWAQQAPTAHARLASAASPRKIDGATVQGQEAVARQLAGRQVQDRAIWQGAPCGVVEALTYLARQSRQDEDLQALAQSMSQPASIARLLQQTPPQHLRREVGMAIGIGQNMAWGADATAGYLVAILQALTQRQDLHAGAFLGGLLPARAVADLVQALEPPNVDEHHHWADTLTQLPRLCQLQATPGLVELTAARLRAVLTPAGTVSQALHEERQALLARAMDQLLERVDARIVHDPALGAEGAVLAFDWMTPEFQADVRAGRTPRAAAAR